MDEKNFIEELHEIKSAEQQKEKIIQDAHREAEKILSEASAKAKAAISQAKDEAVQTEEKILTSERIKLEKEEKEIIEKAQKEAQKILNATIPLQAIKKAVEKIIE
ncbi:MAG TPA: hypothetical protein VJG83_03535 [archaeon]|nr:hypothetical protein [archaeon]